MVDYRKQREDDKLKVQKFIVDKERTISWGEIKECLGYKNNQQVKRVVDELLAQKILWKEGKGKKSEYGLEIKSKIVKKQLKTQLQDKLKRLDYLNRIMGKDNNITDEVIIKYMNKFYPELDYDFVDMECISDFIEELGEITIVPLQFSVHLKINNFELNLNRKKFREAIK